MIPGLDLGAWFLVLDWALRLTGLVWVISRRREPSVSLAWIAIVLAVPFVGLFAYLLVGEVRLGKSRVERYRNARMLVDEHSGALWTKRNLDWTDENKRFRPVAKLGAGVVEMPALVGNDLELLHDSDVFVDRVIADVEQAERHVHIETYIWQHNDAGEKLAEAVIRAAERGVECRVLADAIGSKPFFKSALPRKLRDAGAKVQEALPVNAVRALFARLDLRDHRKIVVVDENTAFTGSQNINGPTFNAKKAEKTGPWIDANVRVQGPAAQALNAVFLKLWEGESQEDIGNLDRFFPRFEGDELNGCTVQVIPSGPGPAPRAIKDALLTTIYNCREEFIMTTPYFVPGEPMTAALIAAAQRGVRVELVMPARLDAPIVAIAGRAFYRDMLEAGIRIFHYRPALLHSKIFTADREIAMIGSTNFDQRSFYLNFEVTSIIYDSNFASLLRALQRSYSVDSDEVTLAEWRKRPRRKVAVENAAQLLAPLL